MNLQPLRHFWHPVALAAEVADRPVASTLLEQQLVLFRTAEGVSACDDLCIHRGTPLSLGRLEDNCIVCAYHGWRYAADGRCVDIPSLPEGRPIPARAGVAAYRTAERYGLIWVCLDEPRAPIPPFPEHGDPSYERYFAGAYGWEASAARMIENFMDLAHLPWIHPEILGDTADHRVPPHQVEVLDDGLCFEYAIPGPPQGAKYQGAGTINHCQRLYLPFTIHHTRLAENRRMANFFTCQPISATRTRRYMWVTRTGQFDAPIEESQAITDLIREQDAAIVQAQRPEELPIDLSEELHLHGSDAVAVAYRRQLAGLAIE
jgi:phenylpropionate dioxygenase-like ring-hydroxylating dioxygenase large terminal subunit